MKITLLKPYGYCHGVSRALDIAYKVRENNPDKKIYILGMLVNNSQVINWLSEHDIISLTGEDYLTLINKIPDGECLIFSAHGHDFHLDEIAKKKNLIIYDATCPNVTKNISYIKDNYSSKPIIFIGIKNHPETLGALSYPNTFLFDVKDDFDYSLIKVDNPIVASQTTLNIIDLEHIFKDIKKHYPNADIKNEVCSVTRSRQESLINIPSATDLILVIGDIKSSNTNRLLEIAKKAHPQIESYLLSDIKQLEEKMYKNKKHIVISSGASTPFEIIDMFVNFFNDLN